MKTINVSTQQAAISLGYRGENLAREIQFDLSEWVKDYGSGQVHLLHQRHGESTPYPVIVEFDGRVLRWSPTAADTAKAGTGRCELQYRQGDRVVKSEQYIVDVMESLSDDTAEPPAAQQGWVDRVMTAEEQTASDSRTASDMAEKAAKAAEDAQTAGQTAADQAKAAETHAAAAAAAQTEAAAAAADAKQSATGAADSESAAAGSAANADSCAKAAQAAKAEAEKQAESVVASAAAAKADAERAKAEAGRVEGIAAAAAIVSTATGQLSHVSDSARMPLRGLTIYGITRQKGTPEPEKPEPLVSAGDSGGIQIDVTGSNLLNYKIFPAVVTKNGVTITNNRDGSFRVEGEIAGESVKFANIARTITLPRGTFYVGADGYVKHDGIFLVRVNDQGSGIADYGIGQTFTLTESTDVIVMIQVVDTFGAVDEAFYPFVCAAEGERKYAPYVSQTIIIPTPAGLPGVPVTSGGNYTDSTGQQWVCDEIDLARGVYIKRIERDSFSGASEEAWSLESSVRFRIPIQGARNEGNTRISCLSNRATFITSGTENGRCFVANSLFYFMFGSVTDVSAFKEWLKTHPVEAVYPLAKPVETPLATEAAAAYSELHTNYPITNIFAAENAGICLSYVADAKNYIDNRIRQLASAGVSADENC